jgi:uncharacterized protein YbbC (DUF1343 family)
MIRNLTFTIAVICFLICGNSQGNPDIYQKSVNEFKKKTDGIITGAEQSEIYLKMLKGKKVGLVVNQSSLIKNAHLLDFLIENKIKIVKIFALEHGIRGNIDRGGKVASEKDEKTGIPIVSIYGKNRRPSNVQMADIDLVVFDIQDVGVRFFTYISSMKEIMEACAASSKELIILDRPNPLGDYIDGPIMQPKFKSFVGMFSIPIVHGLTVGELALMINGEKWLENGKKCKLDVIKVKNYKHSMQYELPVKPSPNLPNHLSVRLYPSLCLFESTIVSIGRGTQFPFQVIGYPDKSLGDSLFVPTDIPGMQMNPEHEGKVCYGLDLRSLNPDSIKFTLKYIIDFYNKFPEKEKFFNRPDWFKKLTGNDELLEQIIAGKSENAIKAGWKPELDKYKEMRKKYLLYED